MKEEKDYLQDITEIRNMMERSSRFSLVSGLSGVLAGVYALVAAYIVYKYYQFNPQSYSIQTGSFTNFNSLLVLACITLVLGLGTAILFSYWNSVKRKEKLWNASSRRLLTNLFIPLITGGLLMLIFISKGLIGLLAPSSLVFYGLALFTASKYTFNDIRILGILQIVLGILGAYFIEQSMLIWAIGFGLVHIIYGIYIYYRYEVENIN
jgi:uncharacterized membrane protein (UPF0182 family)